VKEDYPGLFPLDRRLDTVAIGVVLFAYNWRVDLERSRRMEKFTRAFFGKFPDIVKSNSSYPKWRDVNLQAQLPNWKRCPAANAWLDAAKRCPLRRRTSGAQRHTTGSSRKKLFRQFLE
jgi:uncharacterized protein